MSNKIFVEYQVKADHRMMMLEFLRKLMQEQPGLEIYEGLDQPGLIVEVWENISLAQYEQMKAERLRLNSPRWSQMQAWVEGGREKVHIWIFRGLDKK